MFLDMGICRGAVIVSELACQLDEPDAVVKPFPMLFDPEDAVGGGPVELKPP